MDLSCCSNIKILVCVFIALFGMGSWVAVNGIWVELPILVDQLPEGWNLPSYMAVIVQLANIGPITVTVLNLYLGDKLPEKLIVYIMITLGCVALVLLAFLWTSTSYIAGAERSTALLVLLFVVSLVNCTSSVVFLPFMNVFQPQYMTSFYIGEGLSGLLPSLVALVQGVGQLDCVNITVTNFTTNITEYQTEATFRPPQFSVQSFFFFVFAMMVMCGIAFTVLNYIPYFKEKHVKRVKYETENTDTSCTEQSTRIHSSAQSNNFESCSHDGDIKRDVSMATLKYIYYLVIIGWVNAIINGVLHAIQPYACLPYGSQSYHLAVTLSNIANPLVCFLAFFIPVKSATLIGIITLAGSVVVVYILVLAVLSPVPPLVDSEAGGALAVTAFVIVYLLFSFTNVTIATLFRIKGRKALLWCGAVKQFGSAIGAVVMFVTVNIFSLFTQKTTCA